MKFYFKFIIYAVLIIIYLYLFGIKSLDKFNEGGVLINQKTLTQAELQPKPGRLHFECWILFLRYIFPGVLITTIDPNTGLSIKVPLQYEGFSYSSIVTNISLGEKQIFGKLLKRTEKLWKFL